MRNECFDTHILRLSLANNKKKCITDVPLRRPQDLHLGKFCGTKGDICVGSCDLPCPMKKVVNLREGVTWHYPDSLEVNHFKDVTIFSY